MTLLAKTATGELWLVFIDEGRSIHSWMYTPHEVGGNGGSGSFAGNGAHSSGGSTMLLPSNAWRLMRTLREPPLPPPEPPMATSTRRQQPESSQGQLIGRSTIQELLRQLLQATVEVHAANVTHRDIKTSSKQKKRLYLLF